MTIEYDQAFVDVAEANDVQRYLGRRAQQQRAAQPPAGQRPAAAAANELVVITRQDPILLARKEGRADVHTSRVAKSMHSMRSLPSGPSQSAKGFALALLLLLAVGILLGFGLLVWCLIAPLRWVAKRLRRA